MFSRLAILASTLTLSAAAFGFSVFSGSWETASALTNCSTNTAGLDASEQQLFTLINSFRTSNGVAALKLSPSLSQAAAWMSEDQSSHGSFSHTDSLGRSPFTRVQNCGYGSSGAGENLALTSSAQSAFNLWQNSTAGHRENMLNSRWTVMGIGHAGNIWTADFGSLDDSGQVGQPTQAQPTQPTQPQSTQSAQPTQASASPTAALPTSTPVVQQKVPVKRAVVPLIMTE